MRAVWTCMTCMTGFDWGRTEKPTECPLCGGSTMGFKYVKMDGLLWSCNVCKKAMVIADIKPERPCPKCRVAKWQRIG